MSSNLPQGLRQSRIRPQCRNLGSIPGSGGSPGGGNGNPLQYSCLESSLDRGAWSTTVRVVAESDTTEWLTHTASQDRTLLSGYLHRNCSFSKMPPNGVWTLYTSTVRLVGWLQAPLQKLHGGVLLGGPVWLHKPSRKTTGRRKGNCTFSLFFCEWIGSSGKLRLHGISCLSFWSDTFLS